MKIAVIGANGNLGARVTKQALDRGHAVKGFLHSVRTPDARAEFVVKSLFDITRTVMCSSARTGAVSMRIRN